MCGGGAGKPRRMSRQVVDILNAERTVNSEAPPSTLYEMVPPGVFSGGFSDYAWHTCFRFARCSR